MNPSICRSSWDSCCGIQLCPVSFVCDVQGAWPRRYSIVYHDRKEALSNVMRHSDATQVRIEVIEHPALYQLIVPG